MIRTRHATLALALLGFGCLGDKDGASDPGDSGTEGSSSTTGATDATGSTSGAMTGTGGSGGAEAGIRVRLTGEFDPGFFWGDGFHVFLRRGCVGQGGPGEDVEKAFVAHGPPYDVVQLQSRWSQLPDADASCTFEYWAFAEEDSYDVADYCEVHFGTSPRVTTADAPGELVVDVALHIVDCQSSAGDTDWGGSTGTSTSTSG